MVNYMLKLELDKKFIEIDNIFYGNEFKQLEPENKYYKVLHKKIKNIFTPKLYLKEENYQGYLEFKNSVYEYYLFGKGELKNIIKKLKLNLIEVDNTEKLFSKIQNIFKDK